MRQGRKRWEERDRRRGAVKDRREREIGVGQARKRREERGRRGGAVQDRREREGGREERGNGREKRAGTMVQTVNNR